MKCSNCGAACCVYKLDDYDWYEVAKHMGITIEELTTKFPERKVDGHCTFLKDYKCSIYDFKPFVCGDYKCEEYEKE